MPKQIAFFRAINVGGHNVTMEQLRSLFEALGLKGVETFLASGNVLFDGGSGRTRTLGQMPFSRKPPGHVSRFAE
jgi:uncharacterized protein (DUF1697 family)